MATTAAPAAMPAAGNGVHKQTSSSTAAPADKMSATAIVFQAAQAHWLSACLRVMLELKVADHLVAATDTTSTTTTSSSSGGGTNAPAGEADHAAAAGGVELQQLAKACGLTAPGAPSYLYKVLRVLAQHSLLEELPGKRFAPNTATRELVQGEDASLGHMVHHLVNGPKWDAWKMLPEAVRQGKTAFALAHGMDVYQYGEAPENKEFGEEFCKAMTYFTRHSLEGGTTTLQAAYDWGSAKVIMDVGGGHGHLLSTVMSWAGPEVKGVLLDRQFVVDSVDIPGMFEAKGIKGAAQRLQLLVGDARESFPAAAKEAGVDTLLMKHFLSAFSDEDAAAIVANCKAALAPGGKILLLQTLVPEAGDKDHNACEDGVAPGLFAIEILAQCPGGAWRTLSEWQDIFTAQGLHMVDNKAVGCNINLMVWKPDQ